MRSINVRYLLTLLTYTLSLDYMISLETDMYINFSCIGNFSSFSKDDILVFIKF